jgi:hypothetical protein
MTPAIEAPALRRALLVALVSWLLLVAVTWTTPQGLHFYDPVLPVRALLQWRANQSPHWNLLQRVDTCDLSRDTSEWVGWWAPGTSLLMLPGLSAGVQAAHLLRGIAAIALLGGVIGWVRWFARFSLPNIWLVALAVSLPWMRYGSANLFRYSAEVLAFGAAPWAFLAIAKLPASFAAGRTVTLAVTGILLGFAYWLKFSLLVTILAPLGVIAVWWFVQITRAQRPAPRLRHIVVFLIAFALAPLAWQLLSRTHGGSTPLGSPHELAWSPTDLVFMIANPALAAADAFGPLFFWLVHPGLSGLGGTLLSVAWLGVPGGVLFALLLVSAWRRESTLSHVAIGTCSVVLATAALTLLRIAGDVDQMPRHLAPVSLGALPIALAEGRRRWLACSSPWLRIGLATAALAYVAGPLLFGFVYVFAKISANRAATTSPQSIALLSLPADPALASHLAGLYRADPAAILVVPDPELTLLWPRRALWQFAGANISEDLQNSYHGIPADSQWATSAQVLLHVLVRSGDPIPPPLEKAGFVPLGPPWQGRNYTVLSGRLFPSVATP